ncbi:ATP-binding protein [Vibrio sp. T187]|uniref:ATP-binding protein n=1 Tax=Vibrio TaxID=662 RepID=UPI0010C9BB8F|nr:MULTISPECIES: ATP-binding protein [Vibrio]MBW3697838.1 ATP-binding protein [Vibrio sp. T187]
MRYLLKMLVALSVIFSSHVLSEWQYLPDNQPTIANVAASIRDEVAKIPDPLFMSSTDKVKVRQLLEATLDEQRAQGDVFSNGLSAYVDTFDDEQWQQVESSYLTLTSISQSKQRLLELTTQKTREALTGFGPQGVTQFKQELTLTQLNAQYALYFQLRSFKALVNDLLISPIPVIWAGTKVFFTYLALTWWLANSKRLIRAFKSNILDAQTLPPLWVRLIWYVGRANKAIAWLIAITLSLRILSEIPSLQHLIYLEIFTWWVLGGSIAISFILEFAYRNSRASSKESIALRLSTIRRYVWSVIVAGVILQISVRTLGEGTIYNWISSALFFWFVLVTVSVLRLWRAKVFEATSKISEKPWWMIWAINKQDVFIVRILATAIAATWVIVHNCKLRLISGLSNFTLFSQALAYLFKIEVAKQKGNVSSNQQLVRVKGDETFQYVLPGNDYSELVDYATPEIKQLSKYLLTDSPAICVVSGERGVGTTTMLKQILHKTKNAEPIYLSCPYSGYSELLAHLAVSLGLNEEATEIQVLSHLRSSQTTYLIAIDNAQRLVKPMVGGLNDLIRLTNLLRRSKKNHRALFAIEKSSWRFVDRARGERLLFDLVTFLPKWTETQIEALLNTRINQNEDFPLSFEGLTVPKQWDQQEVSEEERAKQGFYRILWHYSDGNPTVALRFFRLSLNRHKETEQVYVRLFYAPESEELEKMPKPMLAVLRSIVQLEIASPEELSECTQLTIAEVVGTLRYFQSRGFIDWSEDKARVSDHWFRHITNVLDRQHLLVK